MSGIFWIASYPKSGSTWLRALLSNLLKESEGPADINRLAGEAIASARGPFEEATGLDSRELTGREIERLRPEVFRYMARNARRRLFLKIHDACSEGVPRDASDGVWYAVRNPLDVCVSFAHHAGDAGIDRTIEMMGDPAGVLNEEGTESAGQFPQRLLTWSGHVRSWVDAAGLRVHVVRYEDLIRDAAGTFRAAAVFAGLPDDAARVAVAVERSSFAELKRQEERGGFRERSPHAAMFFRRGEAGGWRDVLTEGQAGRIIDGHAEVMRRFGYLDERGNPVF